MIPFPFPTPFPPPTILLFSLSLPFGLVGLLVSFEFAPSAELTLLEDVDTPSALEGSLEGGGIALRLLEEGARTTADRLVVAVEAASGLRDIEDIARIYDVCLARDCWCRC